MSCWTRAEEVPAVEDQWKGHQHHSTQKAAKGADYPEEHPKVADFHLAFLHAVIRRVHRDNRNSWSLCSAVR